MRSSRGLAGGLFLFLLKWDGVRAEDTMGAVDSFAARPLSPLGFCFQTSIDDEAVSLPWWSRDLGPVDNTNFGEIASIHEGVTLVDDCTLDENRNLLGEKVVTTVLLQNLTVRGVPSLENESSIELGSGASSSISEDDVTDTESTPANPTSCPRIFDFPLDRNARKSHSLVVTTHQPVSLWSWCSVQQLLFERVVDNGTSLTSAAELLPSCGGMTSAFPLEHYVWVQEIPDLYPESDGTCAQEGGNHIFSRELGGLPPKKEKLFTDEPVVLQPEGVSIVDHGCGDRRESYVDDRNGSRPRAKLRFSTMVVIIFALLVLRLVGKVVFEHYAQEKGRQAALKALEKFEEQEKQRLAAAEKAKRRRRGVFKPKFGNDLQRPLLEATGLNQVELFSLTMDLTTAVVISFSLSHRRSQQNALKEIFRLDIEIRDEENKIQQYQIDMDGERDPESSWPRYRYQMSQAQHNFIRKDLMDMLNYAEDPCLRGLRLAGLQRVPGFYHRLVEVLKTKKGIKRLDVEWKSFVEDVQMDQGIYRLFESLESISLQLRGINQSQSQLCGLFIASLKNLRKLHVQADQAGPVAVPWMVPALASTKHIEDFVWVGSMARVPAKEILSLCEAVCRLPLKSLNISWGAIETSFAGILLGGTYGGLEKLNLGLIDSPSLPEVERFVRANKRLSEVDITFLGCEAGPILRGLKGHPSISRLSLKEIVASEDTAEALHTVCDSEQSRLRDVELGMALGSSEFFRSLPQALAHANGLQTFSLHGVPRFGKETSASFAAIFRNNTKISSVSIKFDGSLPPKASETICEGLSNNTQTRHLHLVGNVPTEALEPFSDLLKHDNLDLTKLTYFQDTKSLLVKEGRRSRALRQSIEHLLLLNRLGRRGFLDPSFPHELMPLVLQKVNNLQHTTNVFNILSRKPDLILPPTT